MAQTRRLSAHVHQGRPGVAVCVFKTMMSSPIFPSLHPDPFVLSLGLKAITLLNLPAFGCSVHARAASSGLLSSPFVSSALLYFYGKCVSLPAARLLFDEIPHPSRNAVVWNTLISLHTLSGHLGHALRLFHLMDVPPVASSFNSILAALPGQAQTLRFFRGMRLAGVRPNLITILALLPACAALNYIKEIHAFSLRNRIHPHDHLCSGLVEAYGRCGSLRSSRLVFDREIPRKDVVAFSSMVSAYALHGDAASARRCFHEMEREGVRPDGVAFLGVLKACSHAGLPDEALGYMHKMKWEYGMEAGSDHYGCLVDVLGRAGRLKEAHDVIASRMPAPATVIISRRPSTVSGISSCVKAWGALLHGCKTYGEVELAEKAAKVLFELEPDNAGNYVLLATVYGRAGRFEEAEQVRRDMEERGVMSMPGTSWLPRLVTAGASEATKHVPTVERSRKLKVIG